MLSNRRALAIKIQAVAGTPETLTAAEVIYAEDIKFTPKVDTLARPHQLPTLSKLAPAAGRSSGTLSFKVPIYGATAAGTAPFWGVPMQACAMAETVVAVTSVKYLPATTGHKIVTIKGFFDGISVRLRDAKGTWSVDMSAGKLPYFTFSFDGLWDVATDADAVKDEALLSGNAFPTFNMEPFVAALLTVGGTYKATTEALKFDIGNKMSLVPDSNVTNFKRVDIVDRDPSGEMDAEAVTRATYDFFDKLAQKTAVQIQAYVGAQDANTGTGTLNTMTDSTKNWIVNQWNGSKLLDSAGAVFAITANTATTLTVSGTPASGNYAIYNAGKLIRFTAPKCVFENVNDGNANGIYRMGLPFKPYMNAGDDEIEVFCI